MVKRRLWGPSPQSLLFITLLSAALAQDAEWAGEPELYALAQVIHRDVQRHQPGRDPSEGLFAYRGPADERKGDTLHVWYNGSDHYEGLKVTVGPAAPATRRGWPPAAQRGAVASGSADFPPLLRSLQVRALAASLASALFVCVRYRPRRVPIRSFRDTAALFW